MVKECPKLVVLRPVSRNSPVREFHSLDDEHDNDDNV